MGGAVRKSFLGVVILTALVVPMAPGGADLRWVPPIMGVISVAVLVLAAAALMAICGTGIAFN